MIEAQKFRGIEYIRLKQLPDDQKKAFQNWLNADLIIKIQTDSTLLTDCVLYKNYQYWFEKIYTSAVSGESEKAKSDLQPKRNALGGLAFD